MDRTAQDEAIQNAVTELREAVKGLLTEYPRRHPKLNVKKDYHLMVQIEAAKRALANSENF